MPKLTMTRGLPGSGKSTWANAQVLGSFGQIKRLNKDLMRAMLDAGEWSKGNEKVILATRDLLIRTFLRQGLNVIVDDTNLHPKHEARLREIAKDCNATFKIQDFTHVSVEDCIRRDLKRPVSVGEKVIRDMWKKFLFEPEKPVDPPPHVEGAPRAIVVDIDGTVAQMLDRGPFEYVRVSEDAPKAEVIRLVRDWVQMRLHHGDDWKVLFCSGRPDSCREDTENWLKEHVLNGLIRRGEWELFMRPTWVVDPKSGKKIKDHRNDAVIKQEIYDANIRGKYNVDWVIDDRRRVVDMWRSNGLLVLHIAPGDF